LITEADQLFNSESYSDALPKYQSALDLKPDEKYPAEKINEINGILEEQSRLAALNQQYDDLISEADNLFANESYNDARLKYQGAFELKPGETYPSQKIQEIDGILEELARLEALEKEYTDLIERADRRFGNKAYEEALTDYQAALALKPEETYPSEKIDEINQILAEFAAREELEENYANAIASGDEAFGNQSYEEALGFFNQALTLKPDEFYPSEKVKEINALLEEIARKEELERSYNDFIAQADGSFESELFEQALESYTRASELKPDEEYPKEKISEVNEILNRLAEEAEIQRQYDEAISFADKHLEAQDYDNALLEYKKANSIKPSEQYPIDQISSIEKTIAEAERIRKLNADYSAAIEEADGYYSNNEFQSALVAYQQALNLKPEEPYPQQRIDNIKSRLEELAQ
jgi:tetratricopeptide (TPR) repeat protein